MNDTRPTRFQFTIRDMLVIAFLSFGGMYLLTPAFLRLCEPFARRKLPATQLKYALAVVVATICGTLIALWFMSKDKPTGFYRFICTIAGCYLSWLALWAILSIFFPLQTMAGRATVGGATCSVYIEAQYLYHRKDHDGDGIIEYAQSLHDLYETKPGAADLNLIDKNIMLSEGPAGQAKPKAGYVTKVLKAQGPCARGGRMTYQPLDSKSGKLSENMTLGYALVMSPSQYGATGQHTYIISSDLRIYYCDLGPNTADIVNAMEEFNPDPEEGWEPWN